MGYHCKCFVSVNSGLLMPLNLKNSKKCFNEIWKLVGGWMNVKVASRIGESNLRKFNSFFGSFFESITWKTKEKS